MLPASDNVIHTTSGISVGGAAMSLIDPTTISIYLAIFAAIVSISLGLQKWYVIYKNYRAEQRKLPGNVKRQRH